MTADLLGEISQTVSLIRTAFPDPIIEVRVTPDVPERIKSIAKRPDIAAGAATVWGIPLTVDETLPPLPGYEVVRGFS